MARKIKIKDIFQQGDSATKLSFLLMGAGNIARKQIMKGLLFFLSELAFLSFIGLRGISLLQGMGTLGTQRQDWDYVSKLGIFVRTPGDNSMLMLIYGIMTLMSCILFGCLYVTNLRSAYTTQLKQVAGERLPTFFQEVKTLLDERFHFTLLTIPVISAIIFTIMPILYMVLLAFTNYDHEHLPPRNLFGWVGLVNFKNVLHGDISGTFFPLLAWTLI